MAAPFFAYMLLCSDGSYYAGHTDDLERRIAEHVEGGKCAYTSTRRPVKLVWSQEFSSRDEAKEAEARIKKWSRAKKEALIRSDWESLHRLAECRNSSHSRFK